MPSKWPDGRIGPCASCDRIRPLRTHNGRPPVCTECRPTNEHSPTAARADGGEVDK